MRNNKLATFTTEQNLDRQAKLIVEVPDAQGIKLPLTVRRSDLRLVGHSYTMTWITLDPGFFVVQLHCPDGSEKNQFVELEANEDKTIQLPLTQQNEGEIDRRVAKPLATRKIFGKAEPVEKIVIGHPQDINLKELEKTFSDSKVRLAKNDSFTRSSTHNLNRNLIFSNIELTSGSYEKQPKTKMQHPGFMTQMLHFDGSAWVVSQRGLDNALFRSDTIDEVSRTIVTLNATQQLQMLEVRKPHREPVYLVLPLLSHSLSENCSVEIWDSGNDLSIKCDFVGAPRASMLLKYLASGSFDFAANIADDAEDMLQGKITNPIEAALGGYVLLRTGLLERLHDWPENLCNWFPQIADGAIIAAELALRKNENTEALDFFLLASQRGLPIFREGLSLLVARLRSYVIYDKNLDISTAKREQLQAAYKFLVDVALFTDENQELLSFTNVPIINNDSIKPCWRYVMPKPISYQGDSLVTFPAFFEGDPHV